MARSRAQAGDGKLGCILWTLLVVVGGLIAFKTIPVKLASSELYDFMVEQAKFAGGATAEVIQRRIVQKGMELKLPIDPKKVTAERYGDNIRMRAVFTVPLDFPGYTHQWHFDLQVDRPIYIF